MKRIIGIVSVLIIVSACGEHACPTYNGGGDSQYAFSYVGFKKINPPKGKKPKQRKVRRAERD